MHTKWLVRFKIDSYLGIHTTAYEQEFYLEEMIYVYMCINTCKNKKD